MRIGSIVIWVMVAFQYSPSYGDDTKLNRFDSYTGLIMTGYQGWFNTPTDGADQKWRHYSNNGKFEPGTCSIDFWPDMTEYQDRYKTAFKFADGTPAFVFSSYDFSTTDLHFKWMKEYGIDGAFMQRFIHSMHKGKIRNHYNTVFHNAFEAAKTHQRAITIRYDLTDMDINGPEVLFNDLDALNQKYNFFDRSFSPTFLHHNGKPLIAIGGIGFTADTAGDDLGYLRSAEVIISGLRKRGFSIMMRVPSTWRIFGGATVVSKPEDRTRLHDLIKSVDIVMPWHVGSFSENTYLKNSWDETIAGDIQWCDDNDLDYVPVLWPGFSRTNLRNGDTSSFRPRNKGSFLWLQVENAIRAGTDKFFLAQFDEMDEGTQFFKCLEKPPIGGSPFVGYETSVGSDHYLWLAEQAGRALRHEIPITKNVPKRIP